MSQDHIFETLANILQKVTGAAPERITPDAHLNSDLGIDSLSMIEVAVAAEDNLGVRVEDDDLTELETVNDVAELLRRNVTASRP